MEQVKPSGVSPSGVSPISVVPKTGPKEPEPLSLSAPSAISTYDDEENSDDDDPSSELMKRRDIFHPDLIELYNLTPGRRKNIESGELNDEMDERDREIFLHELATHYYPDGFFATQRVQDLGFRQDQIDKIAKLLLPWKDIPYKSDYDPSKHRKFFRPAGLSRKYKVKGGKKRRPTKRRPTKRKTRKGKKGKRRRTKRR